MIFSALLMMSLTFINMNIVKLHLTLDVLMFIMCFLNYGLFTVAILLGNTMYMKAWPGCVSGIIGIMYLISLFNPKLFRWMMLEKIEEKDGMSSVSRPKYFILPIYEWVTMGLNVLFLILVLVSWLFA